MKRAIEREMLNHFQDWLIDREKSPGTVEKYVRDAEAFAAWLGDRPLTKEAVMGWRDSLLAAGLKPGTVNGKLAAVTALLTFLGWEDCKVKPLKVQRRTFREPERELKREEFQRLVDTAKRLGKTRLVLIMEAICATGIRVSEVEDITVETVEREEATADNKGKVRPVILPGQLCRKLKKYARKQGITTGPIFRTRTGNPISRRQIWAEMKALCEKAGVAASKVFPHNLRHLFATVFFNACHDVSKLADVLGHSNINTTRIYLMTSGAEHRRLLDGLRLVS